MIFRVQIDKRAIDDIRQGILYYEEQLEGLGDKFLSEVDHQMELLGQNPFFQVRYSTVRCLPLGRFSIYDPLFRIGKEENRKSPYSDSYITEPEKILD